MLGTSTIQHLQADDLVARCAIFPKFQPSGAFSYSALLRFDTDKDDKKRRVMSVVSRSMADGEEGIHAYGCKAATVGNERISIRLGREPSVLEETIHYIGFYDVEVMRCLEASNDCYEVTVIHHPENGENAHFHVTMIEKEGAEKAPHKGAKRVEIVDRLWRHLVGPTRYVCESDSAIRAELETIPLPEKKSV